MEIQNLKSYLQGHPFLEGLSDETLDLLAGCARNVRFDPGAMLFHQGDSADEFYLVRYGSVSVEIPSQGGEPVSIQTIADGDVLGWSWMFPPYKWRFDARALTMTRTLALDGACLRGKCEQDHTLGFDLMKRFAAVMGQRLEATRLQLIDLYGSSGG